MTGRRPPVNLAFLSCGLRWLVATPHRESIEPTVKQIGSARNQTGTHAREIVTAADLSRCDEVPELRRDGLVALSVETSQDLPLAWEMGRHQTGMGRNRSTACSGCVMAHTPGSRLRLAAVVRTSAAASVVPATRTALVPFSSPATARPTNTSLPKSRGGSDRPFAPGRAEHNSLQAATPIRIMRGHFTRRRRPGTEVPAVEHRGSPLPCCVAGKRFAGMT